MDRLPAQMGRVRLPRYSGVTTTAGQSLETGHCPLQQVSAPCMDISGDSMRENAILSDLHIRVRSLFFGLHAYVGLTHYTLALVYFVG